MQLDEGLTLSVHHRNLSTAEILALLHDSFTLGCTRVDMSHNWIGEDDFWSGILPFLKCCQVLCLSFNHLKTVPKISPYPLESIRILDLSHNRLSFISDDIFECMPNLTKLRLEDNHLRSLPTSVTTLYGLRYLSIGSDMGGNLIRRLPDLMSNLTLMEEFIAMKNELEEFPTFITSWMNLKVLKLDDNHMTTLPTMNLSGAKSLEEISLSDNEVSSLTMNIRWPPSLRVLNLSNNRIKVIPSGFVTSIPSNCVMLLAGNACVRESVAPLMAYLNPNPSLLELAARMTIKDEIPFQDLTSPVCDYLRGPFADCAFCPMRFKEPCARIILNRTIQGHPRIPMECLACSISCPKLRKIGLGHVEIDPDDLMDL